MLNYNVRAALARRHFKDFILYTKPDYEFNWHHEIICEKLEKFANGEIKKLMLFMPPQNGKTELATRRLPSFMLGLNPNQRIAICSYSATVASTFNRDIQRIIDDKPYYDVFPNTSLNANSAINPSKNEYLRNSETFEIIGHSGFVKTVGVGGSLTSTSVDIGIIDDPFKDREEAMSPRIREKVYSWFTDVFRTRLHNESRQLVIMTRWDSDDLAGRILATENDWEVIVFQAINERDMPNDPRKKGEPLWPQKHSLERLLKIKETTPFTFNSLYQQEPKASSEVLVFPEWTEIEEMPDYAKVFGLDFGFSNDPTAVIEVQKHNDSIFLREHLYQKSLTNSDIYRAYVTLNLVHTVTIADSADPKSIKDLKDRGLNIYPAVKGPDSIIAGINFLKDHKLFIHKDSHNLKTELLNYQWQTFGGKASNQPIDDYNHLVDAARYAATSLKTAHKKSSAGWY